MSTNTSSPLCSTADILAALLELTKRYDNSAEKITNSAENEAADDVQDQSSNDKILDKLLHSLLPLIAPKLLKKKRRGNDNFKVPTIAGLSVLKIGDNVHEFIKRLEGGCKTNKVEDDDKHLVLMAYLDINSVEYATVEKNAELDWDELKSLFIKTYAYGLQKKTALNALLDFTWAENEHPELVRQRFMRLITEGEQDVTNELVLQLFIKKIPENLLALVNSYIDLYGKSVDFQELIESLKRAYMFINTNVSAANAFAYKSQPQTKVPQDKRHAEKSGKWNGKRKPLTPEEKAARLCYNFINGMCNDKACEFSHNIKKLEAALNQLKESTK